MLNKPQTIYNFISHKTITYIKFIKKVSKLGRPKYTPKNIFEIPSYRNIIFLIAESENNNKKIQRSHLRIALCKKHGLSIGEKQIKKLNDFFILTKKDTFSSSVQKHKDFNFYLKNSIDKLVQAGWLNNETKFKNDNVLNYALNKLKNELKLIKPVTNKKGYNYYILTKKGKIEHARYLLKDNIERLPDDEILLYSIDTLIFQVLQEYNKKN